MGAAELYKAKVAGRSPAAPTVPAPQEDADKMNVFIFRLLLPYAGLLPFRFRRLFEVSLLLSFSKESRLTPPP